LAEGGVIAKNSWILSGRLGTARKCYKRTKLPQRSKIVENALAVNMKYQSTESFFLTISY